MHKRLALLAVLAVSLIAAGPVAAHDWDGHDADGGLLHRLASTTGHGHGILFFNSVSGQTGLSVQVAVVVKAAPNTTFYIQRAPETGGRPLSNDGICQRANGLAPWDNPNTAGFPVVPAFVTVPLPLTSPIQTVTTGAHGWGTTYFALNFPAIADGTVFDVEFRLVDSLTAPTTDLRTECFSVTAR